MNGNTSGQRNDELPRILIIGAGSRGNAYARAVKESGMGVVAAIAEPLEYKRRLLGCRYVWHDKPAPEQEFSGWKEFSQWETQRRKAASAGHAAPKGIDGIIICVLDSQHAEVVTSLAPLDIHMLCEKPLATSLQDCVDIYKSMLRKTSESHQKAIFGICHVLRYSPHNMLLRKLVLQDQIIGDVVSVEHTEPVGYWHFSHSYVRGNWRRESETAPSLLTKSCHDIDFLLWLLCSPTVSGKGQAHLPSHLSSMGSLKQYRRSRKPKKAGNATNCLQCPIQETCIYSAKRIYYDKQLAEGNTSWPVNIAAPEIESCYLTEGEDAAKQMLFGKLGEDYDANTPPSKISSQMWFGRCVWESDNDVCDDQYVTIEWDDAAPSSDTAMEAPSALHCAKTATFHMIAQTEKQCERRGWIYGTMGEISYDGTTIAVHDFASSKTTRHHPHRPGGGHGGGDDGLIQQFLKAIIAVKQHGATVEDAQAEHLGCSLEEIIRSHAMVFAAEEARRQRKVIDWSDWWSSNVERQLISGKAK